MFAGDVYKLLEGTAEAAFVVTIVFEDSRLHRRLIAHLADDISERKIVEQAFARMVDLSKRVISVGNGTPALAPVELLSDQERRILKLFADAKNSAQVARELDITLPKLRKPPPRSQPEAPHAQPAGGSTARMKRGLI